ncbi:MAG: single-stranded DNA-binding protein [Acidaminococcaceae bacterium]|nr:single-stranded DNA-binding protein [Acidaminococcaceae bacterium]
MTDLNNISLIGRLTRDAEVSYTPNGTAAAKFALAVNRSVKKGDNWVDEASYIDCQMYGKMAESLKPYLTKGKQIGIDGWLKQERWESNGEKRSRVVVNVNNLQLLDKKDKSQDAGYGDEPSYY